MKDIIEKPKINSTNLPRKLAISKVDVYNKPKIGDAFKSNTRLILKHSNHIQTRWMLK